MHSGENHLATCHQIFTSDGYGGFRLSNQAQGMELNAALKSVTAIAFLAMFIMYVGFALD